MARKPTRRKLDEIASVESQEAWLGSPASEPVSAARIFPELRDDKFDDRLLYLLRAPEWPFIRTFLRYYIADAIFEPFATEGKWWNATIREKGGYVRINIMRQEVLIVDFRILNGGGEEPLAFGSVWVDADQVDAALHNGFQLPPLFKVEKGHAGNIVRQNRIEFTGASAQAIENFFSSDWVLRAARTLNLDLMRGGVLAFGWSKFHVPKLIDAVFADGQGETPTEIGSGKIGGGGEALTDETEIQRLVWLRKNQARFSIPVKKHWGGRCAITGIGAADLIEACHIKPWGISEEHERLNRYNGLCLAAHVHAAFDADLIGVSPDGHVRISDRLSKSDRQKMHLDDSLRIEVTDQHRPFLEYRYSRFLKAQE